MGMLTYPGEKNNRDCTEALKTQFQVNPAGKIVPSLALLKIYHYIPMLYYRKPLWTSVIEIERVSNLYCIKMYLPNIYIYIECLLYVRLCSWCWKQSTKQIFQSSECIEVILMDVDFKNLKTKKQLISFRDSFIIGASKFKLQTLPGLILSK